MTDLEHEGTNLGGRLGDDGASLLEGLDLVASGTLACRVEMWASASSRVRSDQALGVTDLRR